MPIDRRLSYIFLDPVNTLQKWQGETIDFDSAVTSVSDKIAEQVDLRTVGSSQRNIKFITVEEI